MPDGHSLAEILTLSVPLSAKEATAIIRQLCASIPIGAPQAPPAWLAPEHVWLDCGGNVYLSLDVVPCVGDLRPLVQRLLTAVRRHETTRFPPSLMLLTALAAGHLAAAPFASLAALATELARLDPADPNTTLRPLFAAADDELTRQHGVSSPDPEPDVPERHRA